MSFDSKHACLKPFDKSELVSCGGYLSHKDHVFVNTVCQHWRLRSASSGLRGSNGVFLSQSHRFAVSSTTRRYACQARSYPYNHVIGDRQPSSHWSFHCASSFFWPVLTLQGPQPQSNGPSYSNTVTALHWPLMGGLLFDTAKRAWVGCGSVQSPPRCTKCNSPPINGQCTNFMLFDVAL